MDIATAGGRDDILPLLKNPPRWNLSGHMSFPPSFGSKVMALTASVASLEIDNSDGVGMADIAVSIAEALWDIEYNLMIDAVLAS